MAGKHKNATRLGVLTMHRSPFLQTAQTDSRPLHNETKTQVIITVIGAGRIQVPRHLNYLIANGRDTLGTTTPYSTAPASQNAVPFRSPSTGRPAPCWSVAGGGQLPTTRSIAGLPDCGIWVSVGPPLLASGPSMTFGT